MELTPIKDALLQVYPQWDAFFRETEFIESLQVDPTSNDGQRIWYNSRRFAFYTPEHKAVLLAREVLHVQLAHEARRRGRDPELWARAAEAVVNELLRLDGFDLPADSERLPADTPCTTEAVYAVLAEREHREPEKEEDTDDARPAEDGWYAVNGKGYVGGLDDDKRHEERRGQSAPFLDDEETVFVHLVADREESLKPTHHYIF